MNEGSIKSIDKPRNTHVYWDTKFGPKTWGNNQGKQQTLFFGQLAIDNIPNWLKTYIKSKKLSICDFGCALGQTTKLLSTIFPNSDITGQDISASDIQEAQRLFPKLKFTNQDLLKTTTERYDVLFSSNRLQYFYNPHDIVNKLANLTGKFLIFLIPFYDDLKTEGHFYSFTYKNIPRAITDKFSLLFYKEIDTSLIPNTHWLGKQILIIYATDAMIDELSKNEEHFTFCRPSIKAYRLALIESSLKAEDAQSTFNFLAYSIRQELEQKLAQEQTAHETTKQQLNDIYNSKIWKATYPFRKLKRFLSRLYFVTQKFGPMHIIKFGKNIVINNIKEAFYTMANRTMIKIMTETTRCPVIIYPPYHDFNLPLHQRPQHLSHNLSKNYVYLFHTRNTFESVHKIKKLTNKLFLAPPSAYYYSLHAKFKKKILFLYSHPSKQYDIELLEKYLYENNIVVYDYLDDLNEEIFGNVSQEAIERHKYILREQRIILLVTASSLLADVKKYRPSLTNTYFVPNAVDVNHFSKMKKKIPELEFIKGKKVIGYFGALALWVDYELIAKLCDLGEDYHILLLGYIYDNKFKTTNLHKRKNLTVLGPIKYDLLPHYAEYFDVSIIPFLINEVTIATSPIKLFEYMALGKPIITTDMPECRKYQSSLIAKDHDEFIYLIGKALKTPKDDKYFKVMKKEAEENTWNARAKVIIEAINKQLNASQ